MKKLIALTLVIIMCASACSCRFVSDAVLNANALALAAEAESYSYKDMQNEELSEFIVKLQIFSARLTQSLVDKYGNEENIVISPISVYMALALACECAEGETRQEILDAVGVTYSEVERFTKMIYAVSNREFSQINAVGLSEVVGREELNNSIWLDDAVPFIESGVNKLANVYHADVFQTSFANSEGEKLINQYIENKSRGLIDGDVRLSPETYFVLMNTLYLKDMWNDVGNDLSLTKEKIYFQNSDGSTTYTALLEGYYNDGNIYDGDRFESFYTRTEHGFKLYFFLPDEEWSVQQIFTAEKIAEVLSIKNWGSVDDENKLIHHTRVLFPEFEADFSEDIRGTLSEEFSITTLFDPLACDMSNITPMQVYCGGVIHKATLTVDKKGIEGAAVTAMGMCGSAGPGEYENVYHDFVVSGAFGFVLTDSYGTVLFSGIINTIE